MNVSTRQLQAFLAVARLQSITRAAEHIAAIAHKMDVTRLGKDGIDEGHPQRVRHGLFQQDTARLEPRLTRNRRADKAAAPGVQPFGRQDVVASRSCAVAPDVVHIIGDGADARIAKQAVAQEFRARPRGADDENGAV